MMTNEDIRQQEILDKIARKGERMAMLTKFMIRHIKKIIWTTICLAVGGVLFFLWGYFGKLKSKD